MEAYFYRSHAEQPHTSPTERPDEHPRPHGPGPAPVPEQLPGDAPGQGVWHLPDDCIYITLPIGSSLFEVERAFIVATLEHFGGDKRRAASALGCSVKTLYNKLHLYRRQLGHVAAAS